MEVYILWERHWDFDHAGNGPLCCDPILSGNLATVRPVHGFDTIAKAKKALREHVKKVRERWKFRHDPEEKWVSLPRKIVPGIYYPIVKLQGVTEIEEVAIRVIKL